MNCLKILKRKVIRKKDTNQSYYTESFNVFIGLGI